MADNKTGWIQPVTKWVSFENRIKAAPSVFSFVAVPTNINVFSYPKIKTHSFRTGFWAPQTEPSTYLILIRWIRAWARSKKSTLSWLGLTAQTPAWANTSAQSGLEAKRMISLFATAMAGLNASAGPKKTSSNETWKQFFLTINPAMAFFHSLKMKSKRITKSRLEKIRLHLHRAARFAFCLVLVPDGSLEGGYFTMCHLNSARKEGYERQIFNKA